MPSPADGILRFKEKMPRWTRDISTHFFPDRHREVPVRETTAPCSVPESSLFRKRTGTFDKFLKTLQDFRCNLGGLHIAPFDGGEKRAEVPVLAMPEAASRSRDRFRPGRALWPGLPMTRKPSLAAEPAA